MKRKQNDADFLKFLQNIPLPIVKNPEFKKSLESLFAGKQQKHFQERSRSRIRHLTFIVPLAAALLAAAVLILVIIPVFTPSTGIKLVALSDPVYIVDKESGKKTTAAEGMQINKGTIVRTEDGGNAKLLFGESTSVVLGKQSTVELLTAERQPEYENYMIRLQSGTIECRINFQNRESSFQIATEYSLITVHGTHFLVTLTPESIEVNLVQGSISLDNYYSLRHNLEELQLKSDVLYTRVSDILNTYVQRFSEKTVIKKDIREIKRLNQALENNIQKIIKTESNEEIDTLIKEIKHSIDASSVSRIKAEDLSTMESTATAQPPANGTATPQNQEQDTPAVAPAVEEKTQETTVVINLNGSAEQGTFAPDHWQTSEPGPAFKWTDIEAHTGRRSLQITSTHGEDKAIGWVYTLNHDLPYDKRIYLKAYIKTDGISGRGVSLVLRADDTSQPTADAEIYTTSQGRRTITGTADWKEYALILAEPLYDEIESITLYLIMLPGTEGTVYFDDISLYYTE